MSAEAIAEFEQIVKDYPTGLLGTGTLRAVAGVSLRIEFGEVFGLLGPNRAGKTTLVKILLTLCQPTSGKCLRFGKPSRDRSNLARVGYVHENHAFPRYLTATSLLQYYGALSLVPHETLQERIPQLLKRVGLADRSHEAISRFSKGMIQRLGIAQAMVNAPDLLVLDEPSEGLDLLGRQLIREIIAEQRQSNKTVLLVSHVLTEVEQVCDRIAVLNGGKLAYLGSLKKLLESYEENKARTLEQALQELYLKPPA